MPSLITGGSPISGGGGGSSGGGVTGSSDSSLTIAGTDAIINQAFTPTWTGAHIWNVADAGTNTVPVNTSLQHRNSAAGTPAAGYGIGLAFNLDSAARTLRNAAEIDAVWSTATDTAEVSSVAVKTMLAGVLTETMRLGTGATLPDSDQSFSMGRLVIDSRTTDTVNFSHRDNTGTTSYALQFGATGFVGLNALTGSSGALRANNTTKFAWSTAGLSFFGATVAAQQNITGSRGANAALADLLTKLATIGLITDGTTA